MKNLLIYLLLSIGLASCGASPDETTPGRCALDCSSVTILGGGGDYKILPLSDTELTAVACSGTSQGPYTYSFKVVKTNEDIIDYDGNGKVTTGADTDGSKGTPIGGVAINVDTSGGIWATGEPYNAQVDDSGSPGEKVGIATQSDLMCTDSCGVFTVQLGLDCDTAGAGSFTVSSGAVGHTTEVTVENGTALWGGEVNFDP